MWKMIIVCGVLLVFACWEWALRRLYTLTLMVYLVKIDSMPSKEDVSFCVREARRLFWKMRKSELRGNENHD